ncbi:hypothetical protein BJX96DRAFT_142632 [Aspergillus floccosus]
MHDGIQCSKILTPDVPRFSLPPRSTADAEEFSRKATLQRRRPLQRGYVCSVVHSRCWCQ